MNKIILAIVLFTVFFGCTANQQTESTGNAVKSQLESQQPDYISSLKQAIATESKFPYLKEMQTTYSFGGQAYSTKETESMYMNKSKGKTEFAPNNFRYSISFSNPAMIGEGISIPIVWLHENAELIPFSSDEMRIVQNGKTLNLRNYNSFNNSIYNIELVKENGKLKEIILYNANTWKEGYPTIYEI